MKKVLLIEDDIDILDAVEMTLVSNGYEVEVAMRGDEGIDKANSYQPDLIILDYFLAGSDGAVVCQTLKRSEMTRRIPVMMTSAHPSAYRVVLAHGADNFIAKPFSIGELMDKVVQSLRRSTIINCGGNGRQYS